MLRPLSTLSVTTVLCWAQAVVLLFVSVDLLRSAEATWILREGGGIESVSAVLLAAAALLYLTHAPNRLDWHVPVGLLLLAMRELDFDKRFTSEGVLQLRLYSGDNPLHEQVIGGAVVVVALVVLARLARRQLIPLLRCMARGALWAWLFTLSATLIVVAKALDGLARKLAPLGIELSADQSGLSSRVEELFELFFALTLLTAITLALRASDPG